MQHLQRRPHTHARRRKRKNLRQRGQPAINFGFAVNSPTEWMAAPVARDGARRVLTSPGREMNYRWCRPEEAAYFFR
jgi:hypothetical protein